MAYQEGARVALAGGGSVALFLDSVTVAGLPTRALDVQLYDAAGRPVGARIAVATAFSDPFTGKSATISGFDVAGTADGGFAVVYTGRETNGGGQASNIVDHGVYFSAGGRQTGSFGPEVVTFSDEPAPHIIGLAAGGVAVQHGHFAWIFDPQGARFTQYAVSSGLDAPVLHDLFNALGFEAPDKASGAMHLFVSNPWNPVQASDALISTLSGSDRGETIEGGAGPDSILAGGGADTVTGGLGYDVLSGGAGADRFVLRLDGSVDRLVDFDTTADRLQLADLTGASFTPGAHAVLSYDTFTGALSWDDDGAGAGRAVYLAKIEGGVKLRAFDLVGPVRPEHLTVTEGANGSTTALFSRGDATFDWSSTHFDTAGRVTTFEVHAPDSSWWKRWNDPGELQPWAAQVAQYDSAERLKIYETYSDEGVHVVWTFDAAGAESWTRMVDTYDTAGRIVSRDVLFDAQNQWQMRWDVAGAQPWEYVVDEVDAAGRVTATSYHKADGSLFV